MRKVFIIVFKGPEKRLSFATAPSLDKDKKIIEWLWIIYTAQDRTENDADKMCTKPMKICIRLGLGSV